MTPEIDVFIATNGFVSGKMRGFTQDTGGALPESYPLNDRIVQYVEGTPGSGTHFPQDTNFVGFYRSPEQAINTGWSVGTSLRRIDSEAYFKLYEVDLEGVDYIDVESIYGHLGRTPRIPISVIGEIAVEGSVPASRIVAAYRVTKVKGMWEGLPTK